MRFPLRGNHALVFLPQPVSWLRQPGRLPRRTNRAVAFAIYFGIALGGMGPRLTCVSGPMEVRSGKKEPEPASGIR